MGSGNGVGIGMEWGRNGETALGIHTVSMNGEGTGMEWNWE